MVDLKTISDLVMSNDNKILMLIMDGLGGLPLTPDGLTELETAKTPNLDALAAKSICGMITQVGPGLTPGSGPGHLGLFGYDPLEYQIGRGVLEALGINFDLQPNDVASRCNFCTLDENGLIVDRRAGRIPSDVGKRLVKKLRQIELPGVEVLVEHVKEYRFVVVLRGEGLSGELTESDPQQVGVPPLPIEPLPDADDPEAAERTADLFNTFVAKAREILADEHPANGHLMRGFAKRPDMPMFPEVFGVKAAAIAVYPMYKGLAKLVGMDILETGSTAEDELDTLEAAYDDYDFFFVHIKWTDSAGEDGDFDRRVEVIESVDAILPRVTALEPDVLIVSGDHSTPALLKSHSWHPVPAMLSSPYCRYDDVKKFSERACIHGGLGNIPAVNLMPLALANALRLNKFGA
jgi:2,3-bisphosphoglycerate-independent phosphoglycerate mutase